MAKSTKPAKTSTPKQKPTAEKNPSPKTKPAKNKPAKPAKPNKPSKPTTPSQPTAPDKKNSIKEKTAAKKHALKKTGAKPAGKKPAPKAKKTTVKKEPEQKSSAKKPAAGKPPAKPAKTAAPAHAGDKRKMSKAGHKPPPATHDTHDTHDSHDSHGAHDSRGKPPAKPMKEPSARETGKDKDETHAGDKRDQLRNRILVDHKKAYKAVTFTLDEAREIAKQHAATAGKDEENSSAKIATQAKANAAKLAKAAAPMHVKAASLADILGFNPKRAKPALFAPVESVPEKYRRYYKELLDLRGSLTEGLDLHTEQTLRRSTKEDAGDLSSYGQHMADAGTDTFDRDFALSMVANEQEALSEIDAAIKRIQNGTYGICEITNKPIAKDRLLAVPFTRYSAEAQKDLERNRMRVRTAAGLFGGEISDDNGRVDDSGGGEE